MHECASWGVKKMIDYGPKWLARRLFKPEEVVVDLRRECPIKVYQCAHIPGIDLAFSIDNRSHVDLTLDRLLFELWVGQPVLHSAILKRYPIAKHQRRDDVMTWEPLFN